MQDASSQMESYESYTRPPTAYLEGYPKGLQFDPARAENYIAHTAIGDPLADRMVIDLESMGKEESARLIKLGMHEYDPDALKDAPDSVREFFAHCAEPPEWLDLPSFLPGCRMFHRNTRLVLASMVGGVLVEGFCTNIAKSFFLTGRLRDQGVRRLKQNNRHMLEIFMPGGMARHADGWTHSVRIRLVHAKVRRLLSNSDEWDSDELGVPLCSAHLGFAISAFSARALKHLKKLGASFDVRERESFMAVWRYSGYLMGIPETILFRDEKDALEIFETGRLCEPAPSLESISMASALVNSAPLFAGLNERRDRRKLAGYIAQISRALIGNELANELKYPKDSTFGVLWKFRTLNRIERIIEYLKLGPLREESNLTTILDVSMFDEQGISYKMPDHIYAEQSSKW
ncbi:MAG: oxygenase MpaB family protein [Roseovarius sp.]|nr:oxygenase MpaB family protein [Roseovarius sp.]MCY4290572.1 oxygenase MpaB family protein [Roseovarius sp.]MCY4315447.1 oxygenase MpaB family protein [Roseovarius sp.]